MVGPKSRSPLTCSGRVTSLPASSREVFVGGQFLGLFRVFPVASRMSWSPRPIAWFLPLGLAVCLSCTPLRPKGKSPLSPARMSSDTMVLDVFFVPVKFDDPEANVILWQELDEQHFPPEIRRHLCERGFRVGVTGGQIPVALSRLLELKDKPAPGTESDTVCLDTIDSESCVMWRHMPLRPGRRGEIHVSRVYDKVPVLEANASGRLGGRDYPQAEGVLAVKAYPQSDGRVRLDLAPELHYGNIKQSFVGNKGMLKLDAGKDRRSFDKLAFSATLTPGHMLVVSSLPNRTGSLGHYFLTRDSSGELEQRLMVLRLSQTQHDGLFSRPEVLPLDELE